MNSIKTSLYYSVEGIPQLSSNDSERHFVEQVLKCKLDLYLFHNVALAGGECDFVLNCEGDKTRFFLIEVKELKDNNEGKSKEKLFKQMKRNFNLSKVVFDENCEIFSYGLFIDENTILKEYLYDYDKEVGIELESGTILLHLSKISGKTSSNVEIIEKLTKVPLYSVYGNDVDSVDDYKNNKFYLTADQERLYDKIICKSQNDNIQLYDIASGRGKTTVLIKLIAENEDKSILFISAHNKKITKKSNVTCKTPIDLDKCIQTKTIEDYDWVICDEAQRIHYSTYSKCREIIKKSSRTKMVLLGDTRCSLEEDNKLIPVEEYNHEMKDMPDIRCNKSINKFVECLVEKETMEDYESNIINIVHNEAFTLNSDECFILEDKYDNKKAIEVLGKGFPKVSIYIKCSYDTFIKTKEKRYSVFKRLMVFATRAIEELNIICHDLELANHFKSILKNKKESKFDENDQKAYEDIVDTAENDLIRIYVRDSGFVSSKDIPCYFPPTIKNLKLNDFKSFSDVKEYIKQSIVLNNYKSFFQENKLFLDKEGKEDYLNEILYTLNNKLDSMIGDFKNE